jgi:hypothetical protein
MADFKLTLTNVGDPQETASAILAEHGDDYDAGRGDFVVDFDTNNPDMAVTILVKDVARGDIQDLTQRLYDEHEDFFIRVAEQIGNGWFLIDGEDMA